MTLRELNLEYWGRVHDMCEGTTVKPWECVRLVNELFDKHPRFLVCSMEYEFAVAVVENRPVFPNDILYHKDTGLPYTKSDDTTIHEYIDIDGCRCRITEYIKFSWQPPRPKPKRTFTLNGQELPCPVPRDKNTSQYTFSVNGTIYYFETAGDYNKIECAFRKLFAEVRDK